MTDTITLPREVVEKAIKAFENGCPPTCENGMIDSGGFLPWGEPMLDLCPACLAFEHLRTALASPRLGVTVDPRLTAEEAAAISAALAAEPTKQEAEALADRLDDERMNLIERLADENERLREALEVVWQSQNEACARMAEDFNAWGLAEAIRKRGERHESP